MALTTTKVALVTGAARGIGRAIALRLAHDDLNVAVNDRTSSLELDGLVREIESKGRRSLAVPADISLEPEVEKTVQKVVQDLGSLDVMVANAGILVGLESILNTTVENFDRLMAVNARGTMLCYKYAGKQMVSQGRGGRIIGACSLVGKQAMNIGVSYSASKFAIRGLTQAAARELGQHGITVNAYAPGVVKTAMSDKMKARFGPALSAIIESSAVNRIGTPEDIANLVSYLASDGASFVTGQSVTIDGGSFFD